MELKGKVGEESGGEREDAVGMREKMAGVPREEKVAVGGLPGTVGVSEKGGGDG